MKKIDKSIDYKEEGWNNFFSEKGITWRDKDYKLLDKMFNIDNLKGSLLDVGCGLGDGILYMQNRLNNITEFEGTDFSSEAINKNESNPLLLNVNFYTHDITLPLEKKYNNIICLQTLEHIPDPVSAMKNLVDATEDVLIVASPYKNRRPDENHLWYFDSSDFNEEFSIYIDRKRKNMFWVLDKRANKQELRRSIFGLNYVVNKIKEIFRIN